MRCKARETRMGETSIHKQRKHLMIQKVRTSEDKHWQGHRKLRVERAPHLSKSEMKCIFFFKLNFEENSELKQNQEKYQVPFQNKKKEYNSKPKLLKTNKQANKTSGDHFSDNP